MYSEFLRLYVVYQKSLCKVQDSRGKTLLHLYQRSVIFNFFLDYFPLNYLNCNVEWTDGRTERWTDGRSSEHFTFSRNGIHRFFFFSPNLSIRNTIVCSDVPILIKINPMINSHVNTLNCSQSAWFINYKTIEVSKQWWNISRKERNCETAMCVCIFGSQVPK